MGAGANWLFGDLVPLSYDAIMVDPPWEEVMWGGKGYKKAPQAHYDCMADDEILGLPVGELAGKNCLLWLWAVWPKLPLAMEALTRWGFTYKTGGAWRKMTKHGKTAMGPGYILRSACEPFLIGTIGSPIRAHTGERNLVEDLAREHSRKPDEAYRLIERRMPHALRRADLFSCEDRPGWDAWGDNAGKYNETAA